MPPPGILGLSGGLASMCRLYAARRSLSIRVLRRSGLGWLQGDDSTRAAARIELATEEGAGHQRPAPETLRRYHEWLRKAVRD